MIYLDTSVLLSELLGERQFPSWSEPLVSSRLLEYETWNRVHSKGLGASHQDEVRQALARVSLVELTPEVLTRALEPFPFQVRTLDAIHLSTVQFLKTARIAVRLATLDERMSAAATALEFELAEL